MSTCSEKNQMDNNKNYNNKTNNNNINNNNNNNNDNNNNNSNTVNNDNSDNSDNDSNNGNNSNNNNNNNISKNSNNISNNNNKSSNNSNNQTTDSFGLLKNYTDNTYSTESDLTISTKNNSSLNIPKQKLNSVQSTYSNDRQSSSAEPKTKLASNEEKGNITTIEPELGSHQPKNQREIDSRSIYISNIPFKISPWKLKVLFSQGTESIYGCGKNSINRVTIVCDRITGLPKGFAYIEFANESFVNKALNFDGVNIEGRVINVFKKRTNIPNIQQQETGNDNNNGTGNPERSKVSQNDTHSTSTSSSSLSTFSSSSLLSSASSLSLSSSSSSPSFYDHPNAKEYMNHRNSNHNFIKNAYEYFNYRPKFNHKNNRNSYNSNELPVNTSSSPSSYNSNSYNDRTRDNYHSKPRDHEDYNSAISINYPNNRNINSIHKKHDKYDNKITNNKLVIDRYHYLTPSSRVGVYNNDEESG
ncbi:hypothetical protein C6P42_004223 [Pichia californica]|nr:hypothetical protein C6P42_004223 [[Candida] californica]